MEICGPTYKYFNRVGDKIYLVVDLPAQGCLGDEALDPNKPAHKSYL